MFLASLFTLGSSSWDGSHVHVHIHVRTHSLKLCGVARWDQQEFMVSVALCLYATQSLVPAADTRAPDLSRLVLQLMLLIPWALVGLLAQLRELQTAYVPATWKQLPSQELQAPVSNEAKNMASVTFFKTTRHVEASGHLDYFRQSVWRHFTVFLMFKTWSPFTSIVWEITATLFPVKLQQYLWTTKLHLIIH